MPEVSRSLGTTLAINGTDVAKLTEIGGLDLSADTIDVTALDSTGGYREFLASFKDAGEVSVSGHFLPTSGEGQSELFDAFEDGDEESFTITFPATLGAEWSFDGVVTKFTTGASLEDAISFEATIKVSGQPSLDIDYSAKVSALTGIEQEGSAALVLIPAFNTDVFEYIAKATNTASTYIKLTATSTAASITANSVTLTTTVESGEIQLGAAGTTTTVTLTAKDTGKIARKYVIQVPRLPS